MDRLLGKYLAQKDDLLAGREPRCSGDGLTVCELCNRFLTTKKRKRGAGEITNRTFNDYKRTTERIIAVFGVRRLVEDLSPGDFGRLRDKIAKGCQMVTLGNEINRSRIVFRYAEKQGLLEGRIRFGEEFQRPSKAALRRHRLSREQQKGKRMYESAEIRRMLGAAAVHLKAMILLGVNCGFGNADCGSLRMSALDLKGGWANFPRPKTGIDRRCPLWPETVAAIHQSLRERPEPRGEHTADLVFITKYGGAWHKDSVGSAVSQEFGKLLKRLDEEPAVKANENGRVSPQKINRRNVGFYALRHTFETVGGESQDQVAVNHIMGHADNTMAATYRERISDERLLAVTEHVRKWLFGDSPIADASPMSGSAGTSLPE